MPLPVLPPLLTVSPALPLGPCSRTCSLPFPISLTGLENDTSKACALFDAAQLDLMEWVEDVSLWELRGYGSPSNFKIASVLMADLHTTLKVRGVATCGWVCFRSHHPLWSVQHSQCKSIALSTV